MRDCKKCGSEDINTQYVRQGLTVKGKEDRPFLVELGGEAYFHVTADIEHLYKRCRNCGFDWRENTLDNESKGE